jgi:hypothetical protein
MTSDRRGSDVDDLIARDDAGEHVFVSEAMSAVRAQAAEIASLKISVVAFLAPWAVNYAKDHSIDGLHPVHYDMLAQCGARMDDFRRAADPT